MDHQAAIGSPDPEVLWCVDILVHEEAVRQCRQTYHPASCAGLFSEEPCHRAFVKAHVELQTGHLMETYQEAFSSLIAWIGLGRSVRDNAHGRPLFGSPFKEEGSITSFELLLRSGYRFSEVTDPSKEGAEAQAPRRARGEDAHAPRGARGEDAHAPRGARGEANHPDLPTPRSPGGPPQGLLVELKPKDEGAPIRRLVLPTFPSLADVRPLVEILLEKHPPQGVHVEMLPSGPLYLESRELLAEALRWAGLSGGVLTTTSETGALYCHPPKNSKTAGAEGAGRASGAGTETSTPRATGAGTHANLSRSAAPRRVLCAKDAIRVELTSTSVLLDGVPRARLSSGRPRPENLRDGPEGFFIRPVFEAVKTRPRRPPLEDHSAPDGQASSVLRRVQYICITLEPGRLFPWRTVSSVIYSVLHGLDASQEPLGGKDHPTPILMFQCGQSSAMLAGKKATSPQ